MRFLKTTTLGMMMLHCDSYCIDPINVRTCALSFICELLLIILKYYTRRGMSLLLTFLGAKTKDFLWGGSSEQSTAIVCKVKKLAFMFTTGVSNNRTTSVKRTKCKTMFNIAGIEGQLDVVEPIMNSKSKVFGINLNAQHVNGMTHFDREVDTCMVIRYSIYNVATFLS